ncbi:MAG: RMD1 family protein, partial [Hydrogenovibrio sp.]|nr:RMD1 family protein [Hydrogenovibrio sp.]
MTTQHFQLLSVYLTPDYSPKQFAETLGVSLTKGIEATYYAEYEQNRFLFFSLFDVVTFINWPRQQIVEALQTLGVQNADAFETATLHQDYRITLNPDAQAPFSVDNDHIELKAMQLSPLMIVALVVAQSVGLERFEREVDQFYAKGRNMVEKSGRLSWLKRHQFADYAKELSMLHHDIVLDLMLLDKPNILWDNESYEKLYNRLADLLDLQERFEVVSYKLKTLKDDMTMMMD